MKPKLTFLLLAMLLVPTSASADTVDYLCKVSGTYSDLEGKSGKINETVSVTITKNPNTTIAEIIGSERTKGNLVMGKAGQTFESDHGISSTFNRNSSSGSSIRLEEKNFFKNTGSTFSYEFLLNTNTKIISVVYDTSAGANTLAHTSFSGACK